MVATRGPWRDELLVRTATLQWPSEVLEPVQMRDAAAALARRLAAAATG